MAFEVLVAFGVERLAVAFFALTREPVGLTFRAVDFEAAARLALGRLDLVFIVRPLAAVLVTDLRAAVRDVDRLEPFVTGLRIRRLKF